MKNFMKKLSSILRTVFGYGIMISLFAGGLTFFAYVVALVMGGEVAAQICHVIYKVVFPWIIKLSTVMVLLGLIVMYLNGEVALTSGKEKSKR